MNEVTMPPASAGLGGGGGVVIINSNNLQCTKNVVFIHKKKADKVNKLIQHINSQWKTCIYTLNIDPLCVHIYY